MARFQVPKLDPRVLPSSFILQLILGSVMTGLLMLAGAALIEAGPPVDPSLALHCTAFQIGSPHAAATRFQFHNAGSERVQVRLDVVDHDGDGVPTLGYLRLLDPSTSSEFMFRTPALGAAVTVIYGSLDLQFSVEIHRDDGAATELRTPTVCLPSDVSRGDRSRPEVPQGKD